MWRFRDKGRPLRVGEIIHPDDIEVLIVHRPQYRDWSWPKGKAEPYEPLVQAAVREVEEETGHAVRLWAPLTTQRYRLGSGQTKEVRYWIGTVLNEDAEGVQGDEASALRSRKPVQRASTREIDQTRWVSPARADALLTRRGDRRLLKELLSRAKNGHLVTAAVVILRHAKAVSRSTWRGTEGERPLTRIGGMQALDVVPILSALGVGEALTSPWHRCAATLGPWASVAGARIESVPEWTEDAMATAPQRGQQLIRDVLQGAQARTIAICVHRPTLPLFFDVLRPMMPPALHACLPEESPWLSTAEMLVIHIGHTVDETGEAVGEVTAVDRHMTRTKSVCPL